MFTELENTRRQRKSQPGHRSSRSSRSTRGSRSVPQGHQGGQTATAGLTSWTQTFNNRLHHFSKTRAAAPLPKPPGTPQQHKARPLPTPPPETRYAGQGRLPLGCRSCALGAPHTLSLQLLRAAGDAPLGPGPGAHPCPPSDLLQEQPSGPTSPSWTEVPGMEQAGVAGMPGQLSPQEPRSHTPGWRVGRKGLHANLPRRGPRSLAGGASLGNSQPGKEHRRRGRGWGLWLAGPARRLALTHCP